MVLGASDALTKIGFRRDIKFFFATLVGFLVVLILFLLLLLQNAVLETEMTMVEHRETTADGFAAAVNRIATRSPEELRNTLIILQKRFGVASVTLKMPAGAPVHVGYSGPGMESLSRATEKGMLTLGFDAAPIRDLRRRFLLTALLTVTAVTFGTLLLLLYLPRITKPIEALLDEAAQFETHDPAMDEQQYLIETFRKTIATLRTQEEELRRLHDQQKSRADDFERVTAALTRSLSSGFIAADPSGRLVDVNASGREILHIAADHPVVGKTVDEVFGSTALAEVLRRAIERRESLSRREVDFRTADGIGLIIGLSTVPLLNEQSMFLGMLALFTDLTPVRELERRVRDMQALADLGEMSAGIAHEFRNSMSTILGYLKLAQRQQSPDEMRAKLQRAEEEAALLSAAIVSLLNYTRPMNVERQTVDLRQVVTAILEKLEPETERVHVRVEGEAQIAGDRSLLTRAIENVIRNAADSLRAKGGEGELSVSLRSDPPSVVVKDNGVGISTADASRLFLPFQSDRPGGFGLGLPLAKKIVLLHGGTISLTGRPGEGAEVVIAFPADSSAPTGVPEALRHAALR